MGCASIRKIHRSEITKGVVSFFGSGVNKVGVNLVEIKGVNRPGGIGGIWGK